MSETPESKLKAAPPPSKLREELLEMVMRELLGPAEDRLDEEVAETHVRERYLVGTIAPRKQEIAPEQQDALEQGGADPVEEGTADGGLPGIPSMLPSAVGMTFTVDPDANRFQVTARWGQYEQQHSENLVNDSGNPKLVWKRKQHEGVSPPIALVVTGDRGRWEPDPEVPEVAVEYIIRDRGDHWSVTVFLVNNFEEPERGRDAFWLFQPELIAESPDGEAIFRRQPNRREPGKSDPVAYAEFQQMEMLYRHRVEFAVGHGIGVHADLPDGVHDRAVRISTKVVPQHEVPQITPPTEEDIPGLADLVRDMKDLSETEAGDFGRKLGPLVSAYREWIDAQEVRAGTPDFADYSDAAGTAIAECRLAAERIEQGLALLAKEETAAQAFRFANEAMWRQRIQTLYARAVRRGEDADLATIDVPANRSWYPFQLAFVLINLPALTRLDHPERTGGSRAVADLLWFPTGGGKTEAYLGLTAYTLAIRRLQGEVAGRDGQHGVAVLMRYTLRLLTLQQFQRASTLMCACEMIRREALEAGDARWGTSPFRIGLWVGQRTTPNTTDQSKEAVAKSHGKYHPGSAATGVGSPAQLKTCPWCGTPIDPGKDIRVEAGMSRRNRSLVFCGDPMGRCPFSAKRAPNEGLPVVLVDEEIYRLLPSLIIATVDKFAQMPWKGQVQMLFGRVNGYCERHGFRSPEIEDKDSHQRAGDLPPAKTIPHGPLRPPDLIIQDELHLISGPLGSLVGLYETAVDGLCSWEVDGREVRPKIIASTATIRRAADQVHKTFLRRLSVFPPTGLEVQDNFFSLERDPEPETPGRLYLGICAPGRRVKVALIRVYLAFLAAAQQLFETYGEAADPWMTLTGYFNSMRELGGMRRLVEDDVRTRLQRMEERGLAKRVLYIGDAVEELTSRKGSSQIPEVLDRLEVQFRPETEEKQKGKRGKQKGSGRPIDVLLATNMVSVGVDVPRLGLMVVAGQPKTTSEYIQATSRVGRHFPGIVCTVYNWARPRDLSHYETSEHYHSTFYKHVEALSVTPFSPGAVSRGLTALLVSGVRLAGTDFNPNNAAGKLDRQHQFVREALDAIVERAGSVGGPPEYRELIQAELQARIDDWLSEAQRVSGGAVLGYQGRKDGSTVGLLRRPSLEQWTPFTCLNSLRDVEPTVSLILADGGLDDEPRPAAPQEEVTDGGEEQT